MPAATIRFSRRSRPPDRTVPSRRIGTGGAEGAGRRLNAWRGDADRVRDRTRTGGTRRRRRQQPVRGGAVAPHRHGGARGAADADARARRSRPATRSKQVPWSNSSLLGEVYLAGAVSGGALK